MRTVKHGGHPSLAIKVAPMRIRARQVSDNRSVRTPLRIEQDREVRHVNTVATRDDGGERISAHEFLHDRDIRLTKTARHV
ncbi:hypothetical protein D3C83_11070 [compost metagenome]